MFCVIDATLLARIHAYSKNDIFKMKFWWWHYSFEDESDGAKWYLQNDIFDDGTNLLKLESDCDKDDIKSNDDEADVF